MNSKQLSQEYDRLYQQAADILKEHNPCEIKSCWDCVGGRNLLRNPTYCCSGCPFVSKKGRCTVKALGCKIWICKSAAQTEYTIQLYAKALEFKLTQGAKVLEKRGVLE